MAHKVTFMQISLKLQSTHQDVFYIYMYIINKKNKRIRLKVKKEQYLSHLDFWKGISHKAHILSHILSPPCSEAVPGMKWSCTGQGGTNITHRYSMAETGHAAIEEQSSLSLSQ